MKTSRLAVFAAAASLLITSQSFAFIRITAVGGINSTTPEIDPPVVTTSTSTVTLLNTETKRKASGGLLTECKPWPRFGLEFGALLLAREYILTVRVVTSTLTLTNPATISTNHLHFPIVSRFWIGDFFSLGAGMHITQGIGSVKIGSTTATYSESELKKLDYGLVGSAALNLLFLRLEARYNLGLNDVDTSSGSQKYKDLFFLAGIGFKL